MELIFIEGVSGVGKTTMAASLAAELLSRKRLVREYIEFDYTNPIDFYCTAYLHYDEYEQLCEKYGSFACDIQQNAISAGKAMLVRYYDGDTPLYDEPLLSELSRYEFCYNPKRLISFGTYSAAYGYVWKCFAESLINQYDYLIFDGSLLHHPINDMLRNYHVSKEQALCHVKGLLNALGVVKRRIIYLKSSDIGEQLIKVRSDRGENPPTGDDIHFWMTRYEYDMSVLDALNEDYQIYDVSNNGLNDAQKQILNSFDLPML
ncbi:MAG: hypothetical protein GXY20_10075 [Clostridiales bacterium]|nr:hypothetical protein [Clostridiales bacterium]